MAFSQFELSSGLHSWPASLACYQEVCCFYPISFSLSCNQSPKLKGKGNCNTCFASSPLPSLYSRPSSQSSCSAWTELEGSRMTWMPKVPHPMCTAIAIAVNIQQAMYEVVYEVFYKTQRSLAGWQNCSKVSVDWSLAFFREDKRHDGRHVLESDLIEQGGLSMALLSTTAMAKDHLSPVIATLCANPTFMSGLLAWAAAQVLKVFTTFFMERKWNLKMLLGCGGMPSSHSALCVALTTSVAICHGMSDALFPVCLGFTLIVMYDAIGVRRHAGMQAEVLNLIVKDLFKGHPVSKKKLKELLGHTPLQVGAGAILGMAVGFLCSQGYYAIPPGNGF